MYRYYIYIRNEPQGFYGSLDTAKREAKRMSSRYDDVATYRIVRLNERTLHKTNVGNYRKGIYRTYLG